MTNKVETLVVCETIAAISLHMRDSNVSTTLCGKQSAWDTKIPPSSAQFYKTDQTRWCGEGLKAAGYWII